METITFNNDIQVLYVAADSFPAGIEAAHKKLHSIIPFSTDRKWLGISRPENDNGIQYKAAVEQLQPAEAVQYKLDTLVLPKGEYWCITILDYMKDIQGIGRAFEELLELRDLDPIGYCVEWYVNDKDVKCMIRKIH